VGESKSNRSVGAKVIGFGLAICAILFSFWTVHWLRRSDLEPPRATLSSPTTVISTELAEIGSPRERNEVSGGIADRWFLGPRCGNPGTSARVEPIRPGACGTAFAEAPEFHRPQPGK
jgi:hypothetical protein